MNYSFDDQIAGGFYCDLYGKEIKIRFDGYYNIESNKYVDKPCVWTILGWKNSKSKLASESVHRELEKYLGIISMILSMELKDNVLELTVNNIDGKYVDLLFENPLLSLVDA